MQTWTQNLGYLTPDPSARYRWGVWGDVGQPRRVAAGTSDDR